MRCTLGVDVGTSSTKGVLASEDGTILATATRAHDVSRPRTGWVEMDAAIWWTEFAEISRELLAAQPEAEVTAVGVSGMGPCILLADENDEPVRAARVPACGDARSAPDVVADCLPLCGLARDLCGGHPGRLRECRERIRPGGRSSRLCGRRRAPARSWPMASETMSGRRSIRPGRAGSPSGR